MKVLSLVYKTKKNAGPKAKSDIDEILKKEYNAEIIRLYREGNFRLRTLVEFMKLFFCKDVIVLQMPMILKAAAYKFVPKEKTILLVHDLDGLRYQNMEVQDKEINVIKQFKYIIVHNEKMKEFLISKGVDKDSLYVLELFDYLVNNGKEGNDKKNETESEFVFIGNLSKEKCPFIYQFEDGDLKYNINLYGINAEEDCLNKNLIYKGSFEPEDLGCVEGKIGIVWDGNKVDTERIDCFKNYTRYNNPHKLSCYMACGKPVVVWSQAAVADFVKKENIGYVIDSIEDINNIDFSTYNEKKENAKRIQTKVIHGEYTKDIIKTIIEKIDQ